MSTVVNILIFFFMFLLFCLFVLLWDRYEPSEMLLNVYETVYRIRSTLLAHKNSPRTSQVQTAPKQVPLLQSLLLFLVLLATILRKDTIGLKQKQEYSARFLICRPFYLPKVLTQTGRSQVPQWSRLKRIMSSSQEVTAAGRCRCHRHLQQTTTRKRLQRRTHLAIVVCTCQVRNVCLFFYPSFSNIIFCVLKLIGCKTQTNSTNTLMLLYLNNP